MILWIFWVLHVGVYLRYKVTILIQEKVKLFLRSLIDIDKNWKLLTKPRQCHHIVPWVPIDVRDNVHELAFELLCLLDKWLLKICVPNEWGSIL